MENISNTLYSIIGDIGKKKIQSDITLKIELTRHYIQIILDRYNTLVANPSDESIGCLCEALLHFMLTACTMPSARKVTIDKINIDIVIPNIPTLSNFPDKAVVIQIPKDVRSLTKQIHDNCTKFQPNIQNLWVVTKKPILGNYINYSVDLENNGKTVSPSQIRSFCDIIVDIDTFLQQTKDRTFRFFH